MCTVPMGFAVHQSSYRLQYSTPYTVTKYKLLRPVPTALHARSAAHLLYTELSVSTMRVAMCTLGVFPR